MGADSLVVEELHSHYGDSHILQGLSFTMADRGVLALLGRNGAGKTTTMRALMNLTPPTSGRVAFRGTSLIGLKPYAVARLGLTLVPEHRGMFASLTVAESLAIAARGGPGARWSVAKIYQLFPRLQERARNRSMQLSGGEQQMLAIGRALLTEPKLLLLDEPTQGLSPRVAEELLANLLRLKAAGITMLLVEQNLAFAGRLADSAVILGKGRVRWTGTMPALAQADEVKTTWLGV